MARLLSVNVGLPRDIEWKGRTVHTGIWKNPVRGRCRVGRLNLDGDGQGDLAGHGGEQRAVMVYQTESYDYWSRVLGRGGSSSRIIRSISPKAALRSRSFSRGVVPVSSSYSSTPRE